MKVKRNKKLLPTIVIALLIIIIAFIAISSNITQKTNDPINAQLLESGLRVAVRQGGNANESGDIWIISADNTQKKQLTHTANIDRLHGWSPDNKYIAAILLLEPATRNRASKSTVGIIETKSGKVTQLPYDLEGPTRDVKIVWNGNNELIVLLKDKIDSIVVPDGEIATVLNAYKDIDPNPNAPVEYLSYISPDNKWITFKRNIHLQDPVSLYLYNFKTKLLQKILPAPASQETIELFVAWRGDKILYKTGTNDQSVWEVNADGSNRHILFETNKKDLYSFAVSPDTNKIYYEKIVFGDEEGSNELLEYDVSTKQTRKIDMSDIETQLGKPIRNAGGNDLTMGNFHISPNNKYMSMSVSDSDMGIGIIGYTLNLKTGKFSRLCESWCHTPVWSN